MPGGRAEVAVEPGWVSRLPLLCPGFFQPGGLGYACGGVVDHPRSYPAPRADYHQCNGVAADVRIPVLYGRGPYVNKASVY